MELLKIYTIRDDKAQTVTPVFTAANDDVAKREFLLGCIGSKTPYRDCSLLCLGDFCADYDAPNVQAMTVRGVPVDDDDFEEVFAAMKQMRLVEVEE